jgi:hypothetical protein
VNALRRIHRALVPGGLVLDAQPVGGRIPVESGGAALGTLDMREWGRTVERVAELVDETIADGLFAVETERDYDVLEMFDNSRELVETVREWTGTKISRSLAARVKHATPPVLVRERVRLRVLRTELVAQSH